MVLPAQLSIFSLAEQGKHGPKNRLQTVGKSSFYRLLPWSCRPDLLGWEMDAPCGEGSVAATLLTLHEPRDMTARQLGLSRLLGLRGLVGVFGVLAAFASIVRDVLDGDDALLGVGLEDAHALRVAAGDADVIDRAAD